MIQRLRRRFIRIATGSVALVLALLTLAVNIANFASTNADLDRMLELLSDNHGTLPAHGDAVWQVQQPAPPDGMPEDGGKKERPAGPGAMLGPEAPFSTRYFTLTFTQDGALTDADFTHIAAVTEDTAWPYISAALRRGSGYGYVDGYKFCVAKQADGTLYAIFLDCYVQLRAVRKVAVWTLAADVGCILLVYGLVVLFSRRAIDPVVRSAAQQKQFITDASHELKTPITVIATNLKILEMDVGENKWITKSRAQAEKLKELVNALVTLCRMDEEEPPLHKSAFPVSDAVRETAQSFDEFAAAGGHALRLDIAPALFYCGDEYAVRQLVSILLDNAVKYAAPGSEITLRLERSRRGVTLAVTNRCETVPEGNLNRLFDRFYRADPARSGGKPGFGIGLSIARSIAEGHKGTITAAAAAGSITFTAELR